MTELHSQQPMRKLEAVSTMKKSTVRRIHIRWLQRSDLPAVLAIEEEWYEWAGWNGADITKLMQQRNVIGTVAEFGGNVAGYQIYALNKQDFSIERLLVHPSYLRQKVGSSLVSRLISKLSACRRTKVVAEPLASNLAAQLFLKACGFVAESTIVVSYYEECYRMVWQLTK